MNYLNIDFKRDLMLIQQLNYSYNDVESDLIKDSSDCLDDESRQEIINNVIKRLKRSHCKNRYIFPKR